MRPAVAAAMRWCKEEGDRWAVHVPLTEGLGEPCAVVLYRNSGPAIHFQVWLRIRNEWRYDALAMAPGIRSLERNGRTITSGIPPEWVRAAHAALAEVVADAEAAGDL